MKKIRVRDGKNSDPGSGNIPDPQTDWLYLLDFGPHSNSVGNVFRIWILSAGGKSANPDPTLNYAHVVQSYFLNNFIHSTARESIFLHLVEIDPDRQLGRPYGSAKIMPIRPDPIIFSHIVIFCEL